MAVVVLAAVFNTEELSSGDLTELGAVSAERVRSAEWDLEDPIIRAGSESRPL